MSDTLTPYGIYKMKDQDKDCSCAVYSCVCALPIPCALNPCASKIYSKEVNILIDELQLKILRVGLRGLSHSQLYLLRLLSKTMVSELELQDQIAATDSGFNGGLHKPHKP